MSNKAKSKKQHIKELSVGESHSPISEVPEPVLVEKPAANALDAFIILQMPKGTKEYTMGNDLHVYCSPPDGEHNTGWILSLAAPGRYPTWDELAKARYSLIPPDVVMVLVFPNPDDYINIHPYTFILNEDHSERFTPNTIGRAMEEAYRLFITSPLAYGGAGELVQQAKEAENKLDAMTLCHGAARRSVSPYKEQFYQMAAEYAISVGAFMEAKALILAALAGNPAAATLNSLMGLYNNYCWGKV